MAEGQETLESAVIIPDVETVNSEIYTNTKRRQSLDTPRDSKRPKRNDSHYEAPLYQRGYSKDKGNSESQPLRTSKDIDERKRGRRLFGALLGTLSQSSSSTMQKRVDIEKKQQEKLKHQTERSDFEKQKRLDELLQVRRTEQARYDQVSMQLRHSNMLAVARFLQTKTKPALCYRPWELLPEEESTIRLQIQEVGSTVAQEFAHNPIGSKEPLKGSEEARETTIEGSSRFNPVGEKTDDEHPSSVSHSADVKHYVFEDDMLGEDTKPVDDVGDDVVEGEAEDAVIY